MIIIFFSQLCEIFAVKQTIAIHELEIHSA